MTLPTPKIEMLPVASLQPYAGNARRHSKKQLRQIADSITRFGFTNPVLVSDAGEIVAGHGRVLTAKLLGIETVPTLRLSHLSQEERRAYVLADNKLALNAGWDTEILAIEFQALIDLEFDLTLTGFSLADLIFTDPPYNVRIDGHVSGLGAVRHREFAFASGEMTRSEFTAFLTRTLSNAAAEAKDGAIAIVCMDWRHMRELLKTVYRACQTIGFPKPRGTTFPLWRDCKDRI